MKAYHKLRARLVNYLIERAERIQNERVRQPIPAGVGRMALAELLPIGSVGIELGVAEGYFSDALLQHSRLKRLYSIDAWADHHDSAEYLKAVRRLARHQTRSVVLRMYFDDALELFADASIDFIYLDAYAHTGQEDGDLIEKWWPKLRSDGLFAGHDYDPKWPRTIQAVDTFCAAKGLEPKILPGARTGIHQDSYASWYVYKSD